MHGGYISGSKARLCYPNIHNDKSVEYTLEKINRIYGVCKIKMFRPSFVKQPTEFT